MKWNATLGAHFYSFDKKIKNQYLLKHFWNHNKEFQVIYIWNPSDLHWNPDNTLKTLRKKKNLILTEKQMKWKFKKAIELNAIETSTQIISLKKIKVLKMKATKCLHVKKI